MVGGGRLSKAVVGEAHQRPLLLRACFKVSMAPVLNHKAGLLGATTGHIICGETNSCRLTKTSTVNTPPLCGYDTPTLAAHHPHRPHHVHHFVHRSHQRRPRPRPGYFIHDEGSLYG